MLTLDAETFSVVDLKRAGAAVYSQHPSTRVLCLAYAFDDEPVQVWTPADGRLPNRIVTHVLRNKECVAHNSQFEREIWNRVLCRDDPALPELRPEQLTRDTMLRGLAWGFPASLDQLAQAMGLPFGKDMAGHRVMMQMSKPKTDGTDYLADAAKMERLKSYCKADVELERVIDKLLPPLHVDEAEAWILDQKMNDRGLQIDAERIALLKHAAKVETDRLDAEMAAVTSGAVPNCRAVAPLKAFVLAHGIKAPDLAKNDIVELLSVSSLPVPVRDALLLRQEAAKTSVAKLDAMTTFTCSDGRMRHVVQFGGAGRTQRWSGRGPQIHNFPRPHLKRAELEEAVAAGKLDLKTISSALRSCVVSAPGMSLVVVDFAQIEARVLAWMAGQEDILAAFAAGDDVYTLTAKKVGSKDRTMGKVLALACGYSMGPDKFKDTAKTYGLNLTDAEAKSNVKAWRDANNKIVAFWGEIDRLMKTALTSQPNKWLSASTCDVRVGVFFDRKLGEKAMLFQLPSSRYISYRAPEFDADEGVSYLGMNQYTRKWERIRTYGGKAVENIVQAVARDLLRDTIKAAEARGLNPLVSIHDEIICEKSVAEAQHSLAALEHIIANEGPAWAEGLPMKGEGFVAQRYGK